MAETLAVVDMLDAIGARGPQVIPRGTKRVAAYITGTGGIAWTNAQIAELASRGVQFVLRIDQTNLFLPFLSIKDLVVDIEPGAATNLTADHIAVKRAQARLDTVLYCMLSDFDALVQSVNALGIQNHVWYWVADWNLDRNGAIAFIEQHARVVAVQWASPSSNPRTLVPGSSSTLTESNVDLSVVRADWPAPLPKPAKKRVPRPHVPVPVKKVVKKIHPKVAGSTISAALAGAVELYLKSHGVALSPDLLAAIPVVLGALGGVLSPAQAKK